VGLAPSKWHPRYGGFRAFELYRRTLKAKISASRSKRYRVASINVIMKNGEVGPFYSLARREQNVRHANDDGPNPVAQRHGPALPITKQ
jgi:hypothetical protein